VFGYILAVLFLMLVAGCAGLATYQPRNADEAIRMAKEVGGTGCYYGRVSGNSRPYADVDVRSIVVTTVGKGTTYLDCIQAIPPEMRSMLIPGQPQQ
jgi:hypothetical protein